MKTVNYFGSISGMVAALALAGCAELTTPTATSGPATATPQAVGAISARPGLGVVRAIEAVQQEVAGIGGTGVGAGTVVGGVLGGVVGIQVGRGSGKTAATVLGAAAGAYAGHELEKRNQQQTPAYRITVRMGDSSTQTVTQSTNPDIRVGDRVRIESGVAQRY
jgi:outer membrane lipoprotein SlyB